MSGGRRLGGHPLPGDVMDGKAAEKKERLLAALERGMVMVHLDARRPGVLVPTHLAREAHLRLNLSYRFDPPDLAVSEWGVRCTLSFAGSRSGVAVPWSALFAITSQVTREFWLFPDDMPPELLQQSATAARAPSAEEVLAATPAAPVSGRVPLREVAREEPSRTTEGAGKREEEAPSPPRRGHLRVVK